MENQKAWYETIPKLVSKNDIVGKRLKVLSDRPPMPTSKPGLYELTVWDTSNSESFLIVVTRRDLEGIRRACEEKKAFTFVMPPNSTWSEVATFEDSA